MINCIPIKVVWVGPEYCKLTSVWRMSYVHLSFHLWNWLVNNAQNVAKSRDYMPKSFLWIQIGVTNSAIMSQHEVIFILKHSFQKLANFLKFVKWKCQKNAVSLIISRPITVWLKNDHPQALRMLSYNTHDKVEGIIQEYSLHILLIIVKYLVRCIWL